MAARDMIAWRRTEASGAQMVLKISLLRYLTVVGRVHQVSRETSGASSKSICVANNTSLIDIFILNKD